MIRTVHGVGYAFEPPGDEKHATNFYISSFHDLWALLPLSACKETGSSAFFTELNKSSRVSPQRVLAILIVIVL